MPSSSRRPAFSASLIARPCRAINGEVWYGRTLDLDDDLHQVRQIEWAGFTLDDWAKARGVPLAYAKALLRFLQQN